MCHTYHKAGYEEILRVHFARLSVIMSVRTPLSPYGIAYLNGYGLSTLGVFKKCQCSLLR